jgi:hypothetical protein
MPGTTHAQIPSTNSIPRRSKRCGGKIESTGKHLTTGNGAITPVTAQVGPPRCRTLQLEIHTPPVIPQVRGPPLIPAVPQPSPQRNCIRTVDGADRISLCLSPTAMVVNGREEGRNRERNDARHLAYSLNKARTTRNSVRELRGSEISTTTNSVSGIQFTRGGSPLSGRPAYMPAGLRSARGGKGVCFLGEFVEPTMVSCGGVGGR